ncbi:MAG: cytochrome c biosis protein CcmG, thiol:disulfide interchange protein DsbE [Actinomycetota bacterium]|jgi:thiol-disulfide isomerase/thioredoxin|nr:cytochrome c biosis protein CcmG, thiol:disulfide interchange protein DsbE [Actinomycetota bacterium]
MSRVTLAACLTAVALVSCGRDRPAAGPGRLAPTFSAESVREGQPSVSLQLVKGKPAVVNFFAAWCEPCKRELPLLVTAHRRVGARVAFVGVDVKDSRTRATDLLEGFKVTYPAAYDPQGQIAAGFRVRAMPTTFFLRPDGRIADQVFGELSAKRLDAALARLGP